VLLADEVAFGRKDFGIMKADPDTQQNAPLCRASTSSSATAQRIGVDWRSSACALGHDLD